MNGRQARFGLGSRGGDGLVIGIALTLALALGGCSAPPQVADPPPSQADPPATHLEPGVQQVIGAEGQGGGDTRGAGGASASGGGDASGGGGGAAAVSCDAPTVPCDGACIDTRVDEMNCGGCGIVCPDGQSCYTSTCMLTDTVMQEP